jgi:type VII secretion protein EccB
MQNKRDQLQAYRYMVDRMVSAMVRGEPESRERPMRRSTTGTVLGLALAVVVAVGFGAFGLISRGGNTSWQDPGSIIVERETGTRYVYLDGTLRPVLNYTSALLAAGGERAQLRLVSRKSLHGVPHGQAIGINGAPDALPAAKALSPGSWSVCSSAVDQTNGTQRPVVVLDLGGTPAASAVSDSQAALVRSEAGAEYLVWHDSRLRVADDSVLVALGFAGTPAISVRASWLNALRSGPDLVAYPPADVGAAGPQVGGSTTRVGQVLLTRLADGRTTSYLVRSDGLSPITQTDAALLLANPRTKAAYPGQAVASVVVNINDVAATSRSRTVDLRSDYPQSPPRPIGSAQLVGRSLCARIDFSPRKGQHVKLVTVDSDSLDVSADDHPSAVGMADSVMVPPDGGAVVAGQASPGVDTGARYLVTDLGMKFPLPSDEVATALGYAGQVPLAVPTSLLGLLPTGPVLDPTIARSEQGLNR